MHIELDIFFSISLLYFNYILFMLRERERERERERIKIKFYYIYTLYFITSIHHIVPMYCIVNFRVVDCLCKDLQVFMY